MAEKKQIIKKEVTVSKAIREVKKEADAKVNQVEGKDAAEQVVAENMKVSSLDLLWNHTLSELDEWADRADYRDELFLNVAKTYAETIKRNSDNVKAINEQFVKEMAEWEKTAREEFLMTTTAIQHFVPVRSYEEINQMFDSLQSRASSILYAPFRAVTGGEPTEKVIEMVEQFIQYRKEGRMQYIRNVKQTANQIYENQKKFVDLFTNQIKNVLFPFNKYLEKTEDLVK